MIARVIHIITKLELGGAQQNTLYTVGNLDRSRYGVALWSGDGGILNGDAEALENVDFRIISEMVREISPANDLRCLFRLRRMLAEEVEKSEVPVIVHTHSSKAGILGRLAARTAGVPIIIHTFHGFGFNDFQRRPIKWAYILAEWITGKATDHFIAVSRANLERAAGLGFGKREDMSLIRSGIDLAAFTRPEDQDIKAKKESLGLPADAPVALMVACFKPQKSPVDFVKVASLVKRELPEARFIVAGDGVLRPDMESAIKEEGLEDELKLLGWRRDVAELMWASDVLVLTSLWEGLPRVFPQAMAAGLPIVATSVDGGPEAVVDGRNGYLFSTGDLEVMASRVIELLKDKDKSSALGEGGKKAVGEFDIDLMVRKQESLYESLLLKKKGEGKDPLVRE